MVYLREENCLQHIKPTSNNNTLNISELLVACVTLLAYTLF